jgi:hypothetical protein
MAEVRQSTHGTDHEAQINVEYGEDLRHYRKLRHYAFFGISGLVIVLLAALILWLRSIGARLFEGSLQTDSPHTALYLTPIVVIASLMAISVLPTMRLVFKDPEKKEEDTPKLGLWQSLFTEVADVLKQYIGRSKPAN